MAARPRILLVEDDPNLAELVRYNLEREDFEVETTPDGEEALLLARETPPDLVVLDWMIESLSGIEVCRRSEEHTSELQSLMRISYAVFCLKKTQNINKDPTTN